jgi:fatty acid-binding protein DegV
MYQIVTDSSWDMGEERAKSLGVAVVPFYVGCDDAILAAQVQNTER